MQIESALLVLGLLWALPTQAGPPFVTDDPEPVEAGAWEINYAVTGTHAKGQSFAFLPQIDINYGAAPGLQLHVLPQWAYSNAGHSHAYGIGDTEVGVKYRLTPESDDPADGMVGIYPMYEIPTGDVDRNLGAGAASMYLPVWVQATHGRWLSFGGGGYWVNSGRGSRNAWAGGYCVLYQFTDDFQFGGEVFVKAPIIVDGRSLVGFNLGGIWNLDKHHALLFSAGRGLTNSEATNQLSAYLGVRATY